MAVSEELRLEKIGDLIVDQRIGIQGAPDMKNEEQGQSTEEKGHRSP
jgi:hypothetical protein